MTEPTRAELLTLWELSVPQKTKNFYRCSSCENCDYHDEHTHICAHPVNGCTPVENSDNFWEPSTRFLLDLFEIKK